MNAPPPRHAGRVAVVTGAGRGIGRSHALRLAKDGAAVVVNDIDGDCAEVVAAEIRESGGDAIANAASIIDEMAAAAMVSECIAQFGRVDILVCNAGLAGYGGLAESSVEDLRQLIDVSLWGSIFPIRAAWPHMISQKYGRVVLTTSQAGLWGFGHMAGYCIGKAAVIGLGRSLAGDAPHDCDVQVNTIAPSGHTRMSGDALPAELHDRMNPDRISPLVSWLASTACKQSGMIFNVGGGRATRVRILESAVADLPLEGIDALPAEFDDLKGPPEPANMLVAGTSLVPELARFVLDVNMDGESSSSLP